MELFLSNVVITQKTDIIETNVGCSISLQKAPVGLKAGAGEVGLRPGVGVSMLQLAGLGARASSKLF